MPQGPVCKMGHDMILKLGKASHAAYKYIIKSVELKSFGFSYT